MRNRSNSGIRLDYYQRLVKHTILKYQNPATGLLVSREDTTHSWVRDNVYSILSVWGLSLAYNKTADLDEDRAKAYELEMAVVMLMRGLLRSMMMQCDKLERFKRTQNPRDALHAKYCALTGKPVVGDLEWGHLQIDATSFYILTLAQMTASGMKIIFTLDEVAFIQNLVFYIETAYRTPDYGIWERGDKTNHGLPELNSSSIGMAKAALEAINELDLFAARGGPASVIHVLPDEAQQCQAILMSMLPRESNSKEVDAGVLSVIGFPAFAVDDPVVIKQTREFIQEKLDGKYGCRRFLRDGYKTPKEDPRRLYYEPSELMQFENIESQWPIFFALYILDGLFCNNPKQVEEYKKKLDEVIVKSSSGLPLMPELYCVPAEAVEKEKAVPNSQKRVAAGQLPQMWGQSLFILSRLISEKFISPGELDPLNRRQIQEEKPDVVVQVVILAEDQVIANSLAEHSIHVQTVYETQQHIQVLPARVLSQIFSHLGKNKRLGLSGRPSGEIGLLATSKLYMLNGQIFAFIPQFVDQHQFYMSWDMDFLVDQFETNVDFLARSWIVLGRPLIMFPVSRTMLDHSRNLPLALIGTIKKLQSGYISGTRVHMGKLSDFLNTSCMTQLDFLRFHDDATHKEARLMDFIDNIVSPAAPKPRLLTHARRSRRASKGAADMAVHGIVKRSRSIQIDADQLPDQIRKLRLANIKREFEAQMEMFDSISSEESEPPEQPQSEPPEKPQSGKKKAQFKVRTSVDTIKYVDYFDDYDGPHSEQPSRRDSMDLRKKKVTYRKDSLDSKRESTTKRRDSIDSKKGRRGSKRESIDSKRGNVGSKSHPPPAVQGIFSPVPATCSETSPQDSSMEKSSLSQSLSPHSSLTTRARRTSVMHYVSPMGPAAIISDLTIEDQWKEMKEMLGSKLMGSDGSMPTSPLPQLENEPPQLTHLRTVIHSHIDLPHSPAHTPSHSPTATPRVLPHAMDTLDGDVNIDELVENLRRSESLQEQADIIHYLHQHKGEDWDTGIDKHRKCTIKDLLGELYEKAGHLKQWWLVRHTAGMLKKRVEDLAIAATDLVVRQKQLSVGMPPNREHIIICPLPPNELARIIYEACGDDSSLASLTQELLIYLAMFIRTEPKLFNEMLRLRVGLIIQVMASEMSRTLNCTGEEASDHLLNLSPFEMKTLLHHILSGKEFSISTKTADTEMTLSIKSKHAKRDMMEFARRSKREKVVSQKDLDMAVHGGGMDDGKDEDDDRQGQWLRRRRLDGALNRVPVGFYPRIWNVLRRCQGLVIDHTTLHRSLTEEMTKGEFKFALEVEIALNQLPEPEYRQLMVEAMMVLATMVENDGQKILMDHYIPVAQIVREANRLYVTDQRIPANEQQDCMGARGICQALYDTAPSGRHGTMTYMCRALAHSLQLPISNGEVECCIS